MSTFTINIHLPKWPLSMYVILHNHTFDPMHYEHFLCDQGWFWAKSYALWDLCNMSVCIMNELTVLL